MSGDAERTGVDRRPLADHELRLPSLTGMRAVAAGLVFLSHAGSILGFTTIVHLGRRSLTTTDVLTWGATGVTFFFVLSGFVLSWSLDARPAVRRFYLRRIARIQPSNAAIWLVFVLFGVVGIVAQAGVLPTIAALFLVQTWIPGLGWANSVNPVAWTLSCELFFYLTFPFLFRWLAPLKERGLTIAGFAALGAGAVVIFGYLAPRRIIVSTFPPFRLYEFVLGIVLALAVRRGLLRMAPSLPVTLVLATVSMAMSDLVHGLNGLAAFVPTIVAGLVVTRLTLVDLGRVPIRRTSTRLGTEMWQRLGEYSFAFYLVQMVPLALLDHRFARPLTLVGQVVWVLAWLAGTVAAAVVTHSGVERRGVAAALRRERRRATSADGR